MGIRGSNKAGRFNSLGWRAMVSNLPVHYGESHVLLDENYGQEPKNRNWGVILLAVIGCAWNSWVGVELPWYIDLALICTVFMYAGYFLKTKLHGLNVPWYYIVVLFALNIGATAFNHVLSGLRTDIYGHQFGNYLLFYVAGIAGSIAFIFLFGKLQISNPVLEYIGKNSVVYYVLHENAALPCVQFILRRILPIDSTNFAFSCVATVLTCVVLAPVAYIITRYFGFTIGRTNKKRLKKSETTLA